MKFKTLVFTFVAICSSFSVHAKDVLVKYVYDGDTFITRDGEKVRLLNINTTEIAKKGQPSEPFAAKAKQELNDLILDKEVRLEFDEEEKDKYNRLLAYVYLKDGTFVNKKMLEKGLAHLYTFPKNTDKFKELKKAEDLAREQKKGIWSHSRWQIQDANANAVEDKSRFGTYQVFDGKVKECSVAKKKTFLNFSDNWRTDFSVEINSDNYQYFTKADIDPKKYYCNKKLRVRGVLIPVNGALISVTHPEQLEILD